MGILARGDFCPYGQKYNGLPLTFGSISPKSIKRASHKKGLALAYIRQNSTKTNKKQEKPTKTNKKQGEKTIDKPLLAVSFGAWCENTIGGYYDSPLWCALCFGRPLASFRLFVPCRYIRGIDIRYPTLV